jgi:subtilisin family serine protease
MAPLELTKLTGLMQRNSGNPAVKIGLIDGPVYTRHPDFARENLRDISGSNPSCTQPNSVACLHGTFVAGILSAKRDSIAPAICPGCILLIRPIFSERTTFDNLLPSATPLELATAIHQCIDAGARVINLSLAVARPSLQVEKPLQDALDRAVSRDVIVVAAAGNQRTLGSTAITRHSWVIPVVGCDLWGRPLEESNLGGSIGRRGVCATGASVTSLSAVRQPLRLRGTSIAAPFVTGAIALLWSEFSAATASEIKLAVSGTTERRRTSVVPPVLNAAAAYNSLLAATIRRRVAWPEKMSGAVNETRMSHLRAGSFYQGSSPTRTSGSVTPSSG